MIIKIVNEIFNYIIKNNQECFSASQIADAFHISRSSASGYLNELYRMEKLSKLPGKPVLYQLPSDREKDSGNIFYDTYGRDSIYSKPIELAMASVHYPDHGLPMLIGGETGVGKTFFARLTYEYAASVGLVKADSPFISFNCADYSANPQLISSVLFGHKKGAFTGAVTGQGGLVAEAGHGFLFLDEAHRLPNEVQEMLFSIIDSGTYRRLGESAVCGVSDVRLIFATTECLEDTFLKTFLRRIPVVVQMPSFRDFTPLQRLDMIERIMGEEAAILNCPIYLHNSVIQILLKYPCKGNIGQLKNDIKIISARAYMRHVISGNTDVFIGVDDVPEEMRRELLSIYKKGYRLNQPDDYIKVEASPGLGKESMMSGLYRMMDEEYSLQTLKEAGPEEIRDILSGMIQCHLGGGREGEDSGITGREVTPGQLIQVMIDTFTVIREATPVQITGQLSSELSMLLIELIERRGREEGEKGVETEAADSEIWAAAVRIGECFSKEFGPQMADRQALWRIYKILIRNQNKNQSGIGVLILAKGKNRGKSIADEVNHIFGTSLVQWYEYDDERRPDENLEGVEQLIRQIAGPRGILILYDAVQWEIMSVEIKKHIRQLPTRFIRAITMPLVAEAVKLVNVSGMTLDKLYTRLGRWDDAPSGRMGEQQETDKKILLTVCLTGYGSSEKISDMITGRYDFHNHIKIVSLDLDTVEQLSRRMEEEAFKKDVICIVGTHSPFFQEIPFISMEDIIFGQGMKRLTGLLELYGVYEAGRQPERISGTMLRHFVRYLDSELLARYVEYAIGSLEQRFGFSLTKPQYVTLNLHLCCMVERELFLKPLYPEETDGVPDSICRGIRECFCQLQDVYRFEIHSYELQVIYEILLDFSREELGRDIT